MATSLTKFNLSVVSTWLYESICDGGNATDQRGYSFQDSLTDGDAIDKAEVVWYDYRTVVASGTDALDLVSALTDSFGVAITFEKVKCIAIQNMNTAATDILTLGGNAAEVPIFSAVNDKIKIPPGGILLWYAPSAAGVAVTAATGDILSVIETGTVNTISYRILIVGTKT